MPRHSQTPQNKCMNVSPANYFLVYTKISCGPSLFVRKNTFSPYVCLVQRHHTLSSQTLSTSPLGSHFPQNLYYLIAKSFKVSNYSLSLLAGLADGELFLEVQKNTLLIENHLKSTRLPSRQTSERGVA